MAAKWLVRRSLRMLVSSATANNGDSAHENQLAKALAAARSPKPTTQYNLMCAISERLSQPRPWRTTLKTFALVHHLAISTEKLEFGRAMCEPAFLARVELFSVRHELPERSRACAGEFGEWLRRYPHYLCRRLLTWPLLETPGSQMDAATWAELERLAMALLRCTPWPELCHEPLPCFVSALDLLVLDCQRLYAGLRASMCALRDSFLDNTSDIVSAEAHMSVYSAHLRFCSEVEPPKLGQNWFLSSHEFPKQDSVHKDELWLPVMRAHLGCIHEQNLDCNLTVQCDHAFSGNNGGAVSAFDFDDDEDNENSNFNSKIKVSLNSGGDGKEMMRNLKRKANGDFVSVVFGDNKKIENLSFDVKNDKKVKKEDNIINGEEERLLITWEDETHESESWQMLLDMSTLQMNSVNS